MGVRRTRKLLAVVAVGAAIALGALALRAADHQDSPAATADPPADITDVYAWMSPDASRVNLIMDVYPNAPATAMFSDQVLYTLHVNSKASYAATASVTTNVICSFTTAQVASCWVGTADFVTGDAGMTTDGGAPAGIVSASGKTTLFAGLRDDPFFFNLAGFQATVADVDAAESTLVLDAAGCPALDVNTANALVMQLRTAPGGGTAVNFFAGFRVLSIVLSIDKTLLTTGGPVLGVWGSTNQHS
jgi:hypothetical protein